MDQRTPPGRIRFTRGGAGAGVACPGCPGSAATQEYADLVTGDVRRRQRQAYAHLFYPGSVVVTTMGSGETGAIMDGGPSNAYVDTILTTSAPGTPCWPGYHKQLVMRGWRCFQGLGKASFQTSGRSYARGERENTDVSIDNPQLVADTFNVSVPKNVTIYDFAYSIAPESETPYPGLEFTC